MSFRPLTGIMVLIYRPFGNIKVGTEQLRFRPLTGIMVLISYIKSNR